jgi:FkbM family methyltransferase
MLILKHIYYSLRGIPTLGFIGACKLLLARYQDGMFSIRPPGYAAPITIRGRTSDPGILFNIIVCREYDLNGLSEVRTIVDAGANIGLAAIYFAKHFPEAKIKSIEPEASNFALLTKNTSHLSNVTILRAALWADRRPLAIIDSKSEKWGFQFAAATGSRQADVEGIPIKDIVGNGVDLLKIDIEGGEKGVFSMHCGWLKRVRYMFLEIHPGCWKSVFHALDQIEYDCAKSGENLRFELNISPEP